MSKAIEATETTVQRPLDPNRYEYHHWGVCPDCRGCDEAMNIERSHYAVCHHHKVYWPIGWNLFSNWERENEEIWRRNSELLRGYREVDGVRLPNYEDMRKQIADAKSSLVKVHAASGKLLGTKVDIEALAADLDSLGYAISGLSNEVDTMILTFEHEQRTRGVPLAPPERHVVLEPTGPNGGPEF